MKHLSIHTFYIVLVDKIQWVSSRGSSSKLSPPPETFPPSNGTPSTTMSGPLPERIEVFPRTLIETPLPGSPLLCNLYPATLPLNNCAGEGEATLSKSSAQFDQPHQLHLFNFNYRNQSRLLLVVQQNLLLRQHSLKFSSYIYFVV
jgi:hypothetical protein